MPGWASLSSGYTVAALLEDHQFLFQDPVLPRLIELTRQPRTATELIRELSPDAAAPSVLVAIQSLLDDKILVPYYSQSLGRDSQAFWDKLFYNSPIPAVSVKSLIPNAGSHLEALLRSNGIESYPDRTDIVLVTDDYLRPEIAALARGSETLLPFKPVGSEAWIGPTLSPSHGMCWDCLAFWLRLRRWPELTVTGVEPRARLPITSVAWLPATMSAALALAAQAVTFPDWAARHAGKLWIFDFINFESESHTVISRANCSKCPRPPKDILLAGLRGKHTGILTDEQVTEGRVGPVYLAHAKTLLPLPRAGVRMPQRPFPVDGKGASAQDAIARCTMEAIERYSSVFVGDEQVVRARADEIDALVPGEILLFTSAQMSRRDDWNRRGGDMHGMPEEFDPAVPTLWVKGRCLTGRPDVFVPAGCAWLWYPFHNEPFYNFADTNGCASGETREDATLRATLGLVERDALGIWWYNRLCRPGVPLMDWDDEEIRLACELFRANGRTLELLDLTHDLGIPVYTAISANTEGHEIYYGSAADICPVAAAKRAIEELIQFWFWETRFGLSIDRQAWFAEGSLATHFYLSPAGVAEIPTIRCETTESSLSLCLSSVQKAGLKRSPNRPYPARAWCARRSGRDSGTPSLWSAIRPRQAF